MAAWTSEGIEAVRPEVLGLAGLLFVLVLLVRAAHKTAVRWRSAVPTYDFLSMNNVDLSWLSGWLETLGDEAWADQMEAWADEVWDDQLGELVGTGDVLSEPPLPGSGVRFPPGYFRRCGLPALPSDSWERYLRLPVVAPTPAGTVVVEGEELYWLSRVLSGDHTSRRGEHPERMEAVMDGAELAELIKIVGRAHAATRDGSFPAPCTAVLAGLVGRLTRQLHGDAGSGVIDVGGWKFEL